MLILILLQANEAVVTGWLFLRYLVIGGEYQTLNVISA